jgi:hypothetical protein
MYVLGSQPAACPRQHRPRHLDLVIIVCFRLLICFFCIPPFVRFILDCLLRKSCLDGIGLEGCAFCCKEVRRSLELLIQLLRFAKVSELDASRMLLGVSGGVGVKMSVRCQGQRSGAFAI